MPRLARWYTSLFTAICCVGTTFFLKLSGYRCVTDIRGCRARRSKSKGERGHGWIGIAGNTNNTTDSIDDDDDDDTRFNDDGDDEDCKRLVYVCQV